MLRAGRQQRGGQFWGLLISPHKVFLSRNIVPAKVPLHQICIDKPDSLGIKVMKINEVFSATFAGYWEGHLTEVVGGAWLIKAFNCWRKAVGMLQTHSRSDGYIWSCDAQVATARALQGGGEGGGALSCHSHSELVRWRGWRTGQLLDHFISCTHFLGQHHYF